MTFTLLVMNKNENNKRSGLLFYIEVVWAVGSTNTVQWQPQNQKTAISFIMFVGPSICPRETTQLPLAGF
jgi:hypothetical protein